MPTKRQLQRLDEDQEKLLEFIGIPYPYNRPKSSWQRKTDDSKILSLSDIHEPYGNAVVVHHVQSREKDAGTLIVPGDVGDYYSKSRFRKTRFQSFRDELRSVFKRLEWMATHWKSVKVMLGNHDDRPEKHLYSTLEDKIDLLVMTESNMLDRLASYFENIQLVGTQLDDTDINLTHIYQHGDIVFTHGELSVKQSTAILERVEAWLVSWREHLKLKPFNVIAQAHNHRGLKEDRPRTRMLLPTASDPFSIGLSYIYGTRMIGEPPAIGYSLFYQENGLTDTNRSHNVIFKVKNGKTEPLR